MKIAYLAFLDHHAEQGVWHKIQAQLKAWRHAGQQVQGFLFSRHHDTHNGSDQAVQLFHATNKLTKLYKLKIFFRTVRAWQPDLVYLRYSVYFPYLHLLASIPLVLEINSDDRYEYPLVFPRYLYCYHKLTRNLLLRRARAFICVTYELQRRFAGYGKPVLVSGNGIDLARYPWLPPNSEQTIRLVFLCSSEAPWHGFDKLLQLAQLFPTWQFEIIAPVPQHLAPFWPPNVRLHGYLPIHDYRPILRRCDVGIGTLALHRKHMAEACPLKVREYLACGLPVITAYHDTDFPDTRSFLLQLPNNCNNIRPYASQIEHFVMQWKGRRVPRSMIRHLDMQYKTRHLPNFFQHCQQQHNSILEYPAVY